MEVLSGWVNHLRPLMDTIFMMLERNYSPPPVSRIFLKFWTILFEYVIVELANNSSEGIYYGLSKSHSGRYCETM